MNESAPKETVYQSHLPLQILAYVVGAATIIGGTILAIPALQRQDWAGIALGTFVLGVIFLACLEILHLHIVTKANGILMRTLFGKDIFYAYEDMLDWDLVDETHGIESVAIKLRKPLGKTIKIPYTLMKNKIEFTQALSRNIPENDDIDYGAGETISEYQIYQQEYNKLLAEARCDADIERIRKGVALWKKILLGLEIIGGCLCVVVWIERLRPDLFPFPIYAFPIGTLIPILIAIATPLFSGGIVSYSTELKNDDHAPRPIAIRAIGILFLVFFLTTFRFELTEYTPIIIISCGFGTLLSLVYTYHYPKSIYRCTPGNIIDKGIFTLLVSLMSIIAGIAVFFPLLITSNCLLDQSVPMETVATVDSKHAKGTRGPKTLYYHINSKKGMLHSEVVNSERFAQTKAGDKISAYIRPGALGFRWIEKTVPRESQSETLSPQ